MADALFDQLADDLWQAAQPAVARHPRPQRPTLILLSGVPLAGKTTLAQAIRDACPAGVFHVKNDAVRRLVATARGHPSPTYDEEENQATYQAAHTALDRALSSGFHALHDATNLTEEHRREAYGVADDHGAPTVTIFLQAPHDALARRAERLSADRQRAFEKLGHREVGPAACDGPSILLDATLPLDRLLDQLSSEPHLAGLLGPS